MAVAVPGGVVSGDSGGNANNVNEVGRRARMLIDAFPVFATEPDTALALAQQSNSDSDLLDSASGALGNAAWTREAQRVTRLPAAQQRGYWAKLTTPAQEALNTAGYIPPADPDEEAHDTLLGLPGRIIGSGLKDAGGAFKNHWVTTPLQYLQNVSDVPMHIWRMSNDLAGGESDDLFDMLKTEGVAVGMGIPGLNLIGAAIYGPDRLKEAWEETATGSRYYTRPARQDALERLRDLDVGDTPTIGSSANAYVKIASDLVVGKSAEDIAGRFGNAGSDGYKNAFEEIQRLTNTNQFKAAVTTLDHGQVSPGRSVASALGFTPGHKAFDIISGPADLAFQIVADPTLIAGKGIKALELSRYGLEMLEHSPKFAQLFVENASVRRAAETIAEHASAGTWAEFAKRYPHLSPYLTTFIDNADKIKTAEGVKDFLTDTEGITTLLRGGSTSWRTGSITVPRITRTQVAKAEVRGVGRELLNAPVKWAQEGRESVEKAMAAGQRSGRFNLAAAWIPGTEKVMTNPILWPAQMLKAATIKVPMHEYLPLQGPEFATELKKMINMGTFAGVSEKVKDEFFNRVAREGPDAARLTALRSVINDLFGYLGEDPAITAFKDRFMGQHLQYFGKHGAIPGVEGQWGLLPRSDMALGIAIPNPREFMEASNRLSLWRQTTSKLNNGMAEAFMSKAWKPSVLLRIGFIPRAAGEEMLNLITRRPFDIMLGWGLKTAAADTPDHLARVASAALGKPITAEMLDQEFKSLGPAFARDVRRRVDWDQFHKTMLLSESTPTFRDLAWHHGKEWVPGTDIPAVGYDILNRYWRQQARAPQALLRPFQMAAGITGGIARPLAGKGGQIEREFDRLIADPTNAYTERQARAIAKRTVRNERNAFVPYEWPSRMLHNIAKTSPGAPGEGMDLAVRSTLYHTSQAYRSVVRTLLDDKLVEEARSVLSDDVYQAAFGKRISAGAAGFIENDDLGRQTTIIRGDLTREPARIQAVGSEWVDRLKQGSEFGGMDPLYPDAQWQRVGHWMNDDIVGHPMGEVGHRYIGPDTLAEYERQNLPTNFPYMDYKAADAVVPGEKPMGPIENAYIWHGSLTQALQDSDEQTRQAILNALESNSGADFDLAEVIAQKAQQRRAAEIRKAAKGPEPPNVAAVTETDAMEAELRGLDLVDAIRTLRKLSPRAQEVTHNAVTHGLENGFMPEFITDIDELQVALKRAAYGGVTNPDHARVTARMGRSVLSSLDGNEAINPVDPDKVRLYIPDVMREEYRNNPLFGTEGAFPEEFRGIARVGLGEQEQQLSVFSAPESGDPAHLSFLDMFDKRQDASAPAAALATTNMNDALRLSAELHAQMGITGGPGSEGLISYIDVPRADAARPVSSHPGHTIARLSYATPPASAANATYYRVDSGLLATAKPAPMHLPVHTDDLGNMVWGKTHEQVMDDWAGVLAADFMHDFSSPERPEILTELLGPARKDAIDPLYDTAMQRRYRSSTSDVFKVPNMDLPDTVSGPQYKILDPEGAWSSFVRYGFDQIGDAINGLIRAPYFLTATLNGQAEARRVLGNRLLPEERWGKKKTIVVPRHDIMALPDIPEIRTLDPIMQARIQANRHIVGSIGLAHPSAEMTDAMKRRFPEFDGFTIPETGPVIDNAVGVEYPVPGMTAPVLSGWMDANLHDVKSHLDELAKTAPTKKLQNEAASLADVLDDVTWEEAPGGLVEGGSHYVTHEPRVRQHQVISTDEEIEVEGQLHVISNKTRQARINHLLQSRLPADGTVQHFVEVGRTAFPTPKVDVPPAFELLRTHSQPTQWGSSADELLKGADIHSSASRAQFEDAVMDSIDAIGAAPLNARDRATFDDLAEHIRGRIDHPDPNDMFMPVDPDRMPHFLSELDKAGGSHERMWLHEDIWHMRNDNASYQDLLDLGEKYLGKGTPLSPEQLMNKLAEDPDNVALFQHTAAMLGKRNPEKFADSRYLINTIDQTMSEVANIANPEAMVRAWQRLPRTVKDPKLPFEELIGHPDAPDWVKMLSPQDLPILRAGAEDLERSNKTIRDIAIDRATREVTPFIDNHHDRSQWQEFARNLTPFWFAEEAFLRRWTRTLTAGPFGIQGLASIRRAQLLYDGLRGAGVVKTDNRGNPVLVYPGTPALTAALGWVIGGNPVSKALFGTDVGTPIASLMTGQVSYSVSGNMQGFTVPSPSPLISAPMSYVANHFPEIKPIQDGLMGPQGTGRAGVQGLVPTSLRRFYDALTGTPESNAKLAAMQIKITAWRAAHGQLPPSDATEKEMDDWLDQNRQQARVALLAQAIVGFAAPATPTSTPVGSEAMAAEANLGMTLEGTDLHPELFADIQALGYEEGVQTFLKNHPDATPHDAFNDNVAYLAGATERISRAPLPTTEAAAKFFGDNEEWIKSFPKAGAWFLPPRSSEDRYDQRAYDQQLASEFRTKKTPKEFMIDLYVQSGATSYYDSQDAYYAARNQLDVTSQAATRGGQRTQASTAAKQNLDMLDERWRTYQAAYFAQHPTFAASIKGGQDEFDRQGIVNEMSQALADPQHPHIEQEPELATVLQAYETYHTQAMTLSGDRRAVAEREREALNRGFAAWLHDYEAKHDSVEPFIRSVIRPLAERGGLPRGI